MSKPIGGQGLAKRLQVGGEAGWRRRARASESRPRPLGPLPGSAAPPGRLSVSCGERPPPAPPPPTSPPGIDARAARKGSARHGRAGAQTRSGAGAGAGAIPGAGLTQARAATRISAPDSPAACLPACLNDLGGAMGASPRPKPSPGAEPGPGRVSGLAGPVLAAAGLHGPTRRFYSSFPCLD